MARYVVIQPDYPSMGGMSGYDFNTSQFASGTMKAIFDNTRAIDVLEQLPYADHTRLAAIGHSLGGHNSLFTAVLDQRIKVRCAFFLVEI
jgi:dipeptidyl aminopeptidase/acylaminoacyl peptidase